MKIVWTIIAFLIGAFTSVNAQTNYYYPSVVENTTWETMDINNLGWCQNNIDSLYAYLDEKNTKGFIILKKGKIVLEKYFGTFQQDSLWYWASAGKSLMSYMIGMAQEKGLLSIEDATSEHLGAGWTSTTLAQEMQIKIRHQLTMTTGLDYGVPDKDCLDPQCLNYLTDPGSLWYYYNAPYRLLQDVLESASNQNLTVLTNSWLRETIGMKGFWFNYVRWGTARDMARFGLLALSNGNWDGDVILGDHTYLSNMASTSQPLNKSYGYLWWLNGKDSYLLPTLTFPLPGPIIPEAPADMYAALGKNDQKIYVIPSQDLVVVRIGNNAGTFPLLAASSFDNELWAQIENLSCTTSTKDDVNDIKRLSIGFPNPVLNEFNFIPKSNSKKELTFYLFNSEIKIIRAIRISSDLINTIQKLNTADLISGIYFLKGNNGQVFRIVKG